MTKYSILLAVVVLSFLQKIQIVSSTSTSSGGIGSYKNFDGDTIIVSENNGLDHIIYPQNEEVQPQTIIEHHIPVWRNSVSEPFALSNYHAHYSKSKKRWSSFQGEDKGGAGLLLLGYIVKACLSYYSYFKLVCICITLSLLFILLCPLIPFLLPALLLILVVGVTLSIAIPLIVTAGGGDGDLLVVQ